MKIEVGKTYVDGEGVKYKIVTSEYKPFDHESKPEFKFLGISVTGSGHHLYTDDGKVRYNQRMNLVKLVVKPDYRYEAIWLRSPTPASKCRMASLEAATRYGKEHSNSHSPFIGVLRIDINSKEVRFIPDGESE